MRVFVVGAGGFIGRSVTKMLQDAGMQVQSWVHSRQGDLRPGCVPEDAHAVVNCAGVLGAENVGLRELERANTELPGLLADACARRNLHLIHLSTPGVVGLRPEASEGLPLAPWGDYERTKAEGETLLRAEMPSEKLSVLRPDFVYGPGDLHKLPLFHQVSRGWFPLVGRGGASVRPTFVSDVARAVVMALPGEKLSGGLFNIGGPDVVGVRQLVECIAQKLGIKVIKLPVPRSLLRICLHAGPLRPASLSGSRIRLFGEDHYVSTEKACDAGFTALTGIEEGIAKTVEWYRDRGYL